MVRRSGPVPVQGAAGDRNAVTFVGVGSHLADLANRVRRLGERSRRFSWYSWGFLFLVYGGLTLASVIGYLFPQVTTTVSGNGISTSTTFPAWDLPVSMLPAVALFVLAVREVILGRREARLDRPIRSRRFATGSLPMVSNWTETVQQCQQKITHAKSDVEWSFLPLVLGGFGIAQITIFALAQAASTSLMISFVVLEPLALVAALAVILPLYFASRHWVPEFQRQLDRQVGEVTRLEAEFLWRFGGAGAPG